MNCDTAEQSSVTFSIVVFSAAKCSSAKHRKQKMRHVELTIEGVTSLMTFPFSDADLDAVSKGTTEVSRKAQRDSIQERAAKKVYYGRNGQPMIPNNMLKKCLGSAAEARKVKEPFACLDVCEEEIDIISSGPWEIDRRSAVNPHNKARIDVVRPIWYDWKLSFTIEYDETIISEMELREVVDYAGIKKGIGSFRPSAKGIYGKFKVIDWESLTIEATKHRFSKPSIA